jgi:hypothetical protein
MVSVNHVCLLHPDERGERQVEGLYDHDALVTALAATEDGRYLASGDAQGEVLVYGMGERRFVGVMRAWGRRVDGLAWDSDGEVLVSLSSDPADPASPFTEHWRLPGERQELLLHWEWSVEHQWSPDHRAFAWIEDGVPMVHEPGDGRTIAFEWQQTLGYKASMLAWSPNNCFLAAADERFLTVWEARTGSLRACCRHDAQVRGIAWPDELTLVTSETGALQVLQQWHLSPSLLHAPSPLPGFPGHGAGVVAILTSDERQWQALSEAEGEEQEQEGETPSEAPPAPQRPPRRYGSLIEEAREAGSRWAEENLEEARDLGVVYREGQEAPHRRFPAITDGPAEAIYTAAWMVGALLEGGRVLRLGHDTARGGHHV